jgi:hypothetical protein
LEWAHDDLDELEREMLAFYDSDACEKVTELDPKSGNYAHKVRVKKPVPEGWRKLVSHALADIRHSIDQSLFAACSALSDELIDVDVSFPWGTHRNDFEARMRKRKYIPQELYPALRRCYPYPTGDGYPDGDDEIFEIRKLAGGNKHRVAIEAFVGVLGFSVESDCHRIIIPYEPWDSAKQEFTFVLFPPGEEPNYKGKLTLGIAFGDVGPLKGKAILGHIPYFGRYAQFVCETLEKEVSEVLERRG